MVTAQLYVEGGGDSNELHIRCRQGFRELLEKCGLSGRMPRLTACGGRDEAFNHFKANISAHGFVAMLIDSEDVMIDIEKTWDHLKIRDGWDRPSGAADEQVLIMSTCMETWIVADRNALQKHYGADLQIGALPPVQNLESKDRHSIQLDLEHATRNCKNEYKKGERSFEILSKLTPSTLQGLLPSFSRVVRILDEKL